MSYKQFDYPRAGIIFLLMLLCNRMSAQKPCYLNVKVTDQQTGEALVGASLKMDGKETGVATDSAGRLRLPVTCAEHAVKFQLLGYNTFARKFDVSGDEIQQIVMEDIGSQIEEIVISAQSAQRTMETPSLGVNVLSMKAVQKIAPAAGEVDILRSLQTLPGISSVGEGANGVNIRGGAVDQNLILLDNMPVFNPTHMLGLFSVFPTDAIREMQIYKGSIPARYGGRTAGVLDLKMSEPNTEKLKLRGGIGLISNRLHVELPVFKDNLAVMSSARLSFNEHLIKFYNSVLVGQIARKRLPDTKPRFFDLANKINWHPTVQDHISFSSYISYDSYQVDTLFSIANIIPRQAALQYGHQNFSLRWNHYFSDELNLNVLAVRSLYSTSTVSSDIKAGFDYRTRLEYNNARAEVTFIPTPLQRINIGAAATRYAINPADLTPTEGSSLSSIHLPREHGWEMALFASDEYELTDDLLAEIGFRYVHYWNLGPAPIMVYAADAPRSLLSITDTLYIAKNAVESHYARFEPRLALRYKLNERSSIKIGYNRMNQFMQIISNNSTPLPDVRWKTANRYVKPAQSDLVSAGYFKDSESRMWEWSVEAYYRWQHAIFDYVNGASLNINPIVETQLLGGKAKAYGLELLVNKKKGIMTGWLSYTYARSLEKITGDFPDQQSLNKGEWFRTSIDKPHTLNILVSFQNDRHNAAAFTFVYSTGRPYTAPVSFYRNGFNIVPVYTDRNNARVSAYHRLDFSWTITNPSMKKRRLEGSWVITIYNLYGRKNAFSYFFNPDYATFKPFKVSVFPNPLFSVAYNFKFE